MSWEHCGGYALSECPVINEERVHLAKTRQQQVEGAGHLAVSSEGESRVRLAVSRERGGECSPLECPVSNEKTVHLAETRQQRVEGEP